MPFTYTNRKGRTYHLCEVAAASGKPRVVFATAPRGRGLEDVPPELEVVESVNGQVWLRKAGSSPILPAEVEAVRLALTRRPRLRDYRVEAVKKAVVIYEPGGSLSEVAEHFRMDILEVRRRMGSSMSYLPVFRFVLKDAEARTFQAERMCYRGSIDGWLSLHRWGKIADLAAKYAPHVGEESFFELV